MQCIRFVVCDWDGYRCEVDSGSMLLVNVHYLAEDIVHGQGQSFPAFVLLIDPYII